MTPSPYTIGFSGLSHLGIVSGICAASKGFEVLGFDSRSDLCQSLTSGQLPVSEPSLPELLKENRDRLSFTSDPKLLNNCDVVYFAMDIPTDSSNQSDVTVLRKLIAEVLPHAKNGATLVVLSQVHPGFTRSIATEFAETLSRREIQLYYQVETLIFGRAVERALYPERYIVGCADPKKPLPAPYEALLRAHDCPILPMRYESAELAKISINLFLSASLCTTNTLAEICEGIGADWSEIIPTLKLDKRIGPHAYLQPGLGIAGGNIERDLVSVKNLAAQVGAEDCVPHAYLQQSRYRKEWALRTLHRQVLSCCKNPTVAVWGLAYKPDTHSIKNSPSVFLLEALKGVHVRLYDPQAVLGEGFPDVIAVRSALEACQGADALVIMTAWGEFSKISPAAVKEVLRGTTIIDPWAVWNAESLPRDIHYSTLGRSQAVQEAV